MSKLKAFHSGVWPIRFLEQSKLRATAALDRSVFRLIRVQQERRPSRTFVNTRVRKVDNTHFVVLRADNEVPVVPKAAVAHEPVVHERRGEYLLRATQNGKP